MCGGEYPRLARDRVGDGVQPEGVVRRRRIGSVQGCGPRIAFGREGHGSIVERRCECTHNVPHALASGRTEGRPRARARTHTRTGTRLVHTSTRERESSSSQQCLLSSSPPPPHAVHLIIKKDKPFRPRAYFSYSVILLQNYTLDQHTRARRRRTYHEFDFPSSLFAGTHRAGTR